MANTSPKPFVFVLMPFEKVFNDIYQLGIKAACQDAGTYCERVDEQIFQENILERIYNQIAKADIIISEMTGRNPNVFYETGYAHALNKRVILLTQRAEDIPFDLNHYPHIVYDGQITVLKPELQKRVQWCIENPNRTTLNNTEGLQLFINGRPLGEEPVFHLSVRGFQLSLNNNGPRTINSDSFDLALVAHKDCTLISSQFASSSLHDEEKVWVFQKANSLLPFSWYGYAFRIKNIPNGHEHIQVQLYTEMGMTIYFFTVTTNMAYALGQSKGQP